MRSPMKWVIAFTISLAMAMLFMLARPQEARVSSLLGDLQAESAAEPLPTPPPTATNTPPSPPDLPTPIGEAYLPALFDVASTAPATISPDATPTTFVTETPAAP